jgi:PTS system nitrogen regulatory IIA component
MPFSDVLAADRIALLDEAGSRDGVLDAAARLLAGIGADSAAVADGLRRRERMGSTAIGHGVAVPHGRIAGVDRTRAAFLRLQPAIDFSAADGMPVDLVFAMAAPEHFTQQHLDLLSQVAERFADAGFRAALREAPDALALRSLMLGLEVH